jgi:hypothetical protein
LTGFAYKINKAPKNKIENSFKSLAKLILQETISLKKLPKILAYLR